LKGNLGDLFSNYFFLKVFSVKKVLRVCEVSSGILVFILAALTALDASGRYLFNSPILGTLELNELIFAGIIAFSIGPVTYRNENVVVDILYNRYSPKIRRFVDMALNFLGIVLCGIITWRSSLRAMDSFAWNEESNILNLPIFPIKFLFSLGFLLTFCVLLRRLVRSIRN
jgi:TRAP-type C4-dicarboxylate transport system permease small subunit